MSRYITDDDGRRWRIETTGMSHEGAGGVGGKGVWFINDQTQDKRIGRISLAGLDETSDDELREALSKSEP